MTWDTIGRFEVLGKLASGGMGDILRVRDPRRPDEPDLLLKYMHPHLRDIPEFMDLFEREGELVTRLDHPHIVKAFEYGTDDDAPYILLRYYPGVDAKHLTRYYRGPWPAAHAALLLADIASALSCIHAARDDNGTPLHIVHRDVNPHNIIIDPRGNARLCDFGVAKSALSRHETRPGVFRGKFAYMAPEQLRGDACDHRADIFSLGVVAFELFSGERLLEHRSVEDLFTPDPDTLRRVGTAPGIPETLRETLLSILDDDPDRRRCSAADLATVFAAAAQPETVHRASLGRDVSAVTEKQSSSPLS